MTVFLPLASSAGWFEGARHHESLDLRVRVLLMIEPKLVVADGGFTSKISSVETSEQQLAPPLVPWRNEGNSAMGATKTHDGLELRMDWQELVRPAVDAGAEGIAWSERRIAPETKRSLKPYVKLLLSSADVDKTLPPLARVREALVKHWLSDCALACAEGAAMAVDGRANAFAIASNGALAVLASAKTARTSFFLPDVRRWSWSELVSFRASAEGQRLRDAVARVRTALAEGRSLGVQGEIDALTHRNADDRSIAVSCMPSAAHALIDRAGTQPWAILYVIGAVS